MAPGPGIGRQALERMVRGAAVLLLLFAAAVPARADGIDGRVAIARARDNRDAVIYLERIPGKAFAPPTAAVVIDQKNLAFQPHVMAVLAGTRVTFPNSDEVRHNVFSPTKGAEFDLGSYPLGSSRSRTFDVPGVVTLLCNVHAEMSSYLVVTETPYFAVTDRNGSFSIPSVPPGRYQLVAWYERGRPVRQVVDVPEGKAASLLIELGK